MNGWRSAIGWASQLPGARSSKIRSVRAHASVSRSAIVSTMSLLPGPVAVLSESFGPFVASSLQQDDAMRYRLDIHTDERARQERLESDVREGLTTWQKSLPPKYFYDRAGSILFERITELPEYYPTRTESTLLGEIVPGLFRDFSPDEIVEIGSGSSEKTRRILDAVSAGGRTVRYVPLDVDRQTIESSAARLIRDYPALSVHAVVGDFERDLPHVRPPSGRRLALFLGSTIGISTGLRAGACWPA